MSVYAVNLRAATASGTAISTVSSWLPLDVFESPFNVGFGVVNNGPGNVTFSVQHTFDDVQNSAVTPTAFTHADVSLKTASIDGNYAYPVKAVRLAFVSASGSADCTITVLQGLH